MSIAKNAPEVERLWTVRDVATYLSLSERAVYKLIEEKGIPHMKILNRYRFVKKSVVAFVLSKQVGG